MNKINQCSPDNKNVNYNQCIRDSLKKLEKDEVIEKGDYDQKGIQIKWKDGEISGTTDVGKRGYEWLKWVILGN